MKMKNILVIGADTCIGYTLCKKLFIDREFCVYGIYVEFNHYGNESFLYARNRNMFDYIELDNEECIKYLSNQIYDAVYWCVDVLREDNLSENKRRFCEYQHLLSSIQYRTIYFFKDKYCFLHENERVSTDDKAIIIPIPEVYGIYQTIEHIVPQIILGLTSANNEDMEDDTELISAWSLAMLLKEEKYCEIERYTLHLKGKDLITILSELNQKNFNGTDYCEQILKESNIYLVDQSMYYMLEVIDFYISNKMNYKEGK